MPNDKEHYITVKKSRQMDYQKLRAVACLLVVDDQAQFDYCYKIATTDGGKVVSWWMKKFGDFNEDDETSDNS